MENKEIKLKWLNEEIETKGNQITYYGDYKDKDLAKLVIELLRKDIDMLELIKKDYESKEDKQQLLDEVEKRYLKNVIRPFRNEIKYVKKVPSSIGDNNEFIGIQLQKYTLLFPPFKKGTMYKNMVNGKKYGLEELGINYD